MTLPTKFRKPDGVTVSEWLFKDLNPRTIVLIVIALVSSHYAMGTRITVVEHDRHETEQRFSEQDRRDKAVQDRLDAQRESIKAKVDKDTYEADRARLSEQLQSIQMSLNTIQAALMQPTRK